jgi:hypothetical protein
MTLRPARGGASQVVAIDYEVAQEQASALGRLGRALEAALAALADFDREFVGKIAYEPAPDQSREPGAAAKNPALRAKLVAEAGHALWCFIVQRESCGLRDPRAVMRDYRVPAEVQNRMGILIPPQTGARRRRRPAT